MRNTQIINQNDIINYFELKWKKNQMNYIALVNVEIIWLFMKSGIFLSIHQIIDSILKNDAIVNNRNSIMVDYKVNY